MFCLPTLRKIKLLHHFKHENIISIPGGPSFYMGEQNCLHITSRLTYVAYTGTSTTTSFPPHHWVGKVTHWSWHLAMVICIHMALLTTGVLCLLWCALLQICYRPTNLVWTGQMSYFTRHLTGVLTITHQELKLDIARHSIHDIWLCTAMLRSVPRLWYLSHFLIWSFLLNCFPGSRSWWSSLTTTAKASFLVSVHLLPSLNSRALTIYGFATIKCNHRTTRKLYSSTCRNPPHSNQQHCSPHAGTNPHWWQSTACAVLAPLIRLCWHFPT